MEAKLTKGRSTGFPFEAFARKMVLGRQIGSRKLMCLGQIYILSGITSGMT